jgi:hypothetical protein
MQYFVERYRDPETGRSRWAVLHLKTATWSFASRYGKRAAIHMCDWLNKVTL